MRSCGATDPRPEVADQVRSLGGEYLSVEAADVEVSATGYAKEMSEDYNQRAADLYAEQASEVDIIITTALIPGRPAPRLITAEMVASMRAGSVIVDMAASNGGNVEGAVAGEVVVTDNGVTIIGYTDLAGRLPTQASQLYGTNLVNLMKLMTPDKDGQLVLDFDDVVQRSMTVVRNGELTWPPPPVQVSATPPVAPSAAGSAGVAPAESPVKQPTSPQKRLTVVGVAAAALFVLAALSPAALLGHLTVFALGDRDWLLRHRPRSSRAAHAADVGDQRDLRDHRGRCAAADRPGRYGDHRALDGGDPAGRDQRLRWLRGDPPDARACSPEADPV